MANVMGYGLNQGFLYRRAITKKIDVLLFNASDLTTIVSCEKNK